MNTRLFLGFVVPLALAACGSSGSGGSAAVDTSDLAGLWDASEGDVGARDERYVSISADGRYTEYDYRQDDLSDEGNCYAITELELEPVGTRDIEFGGNALTGAEPLVAENVSTFRLSDQRTVSLHVVENYTDLDGDGSVRPEEITRSLISAFGMESGAPSSEWIPVNGLSGSDLDSCEGI